MNYTYLASHFFNLNTTFLDIYDELDNGQLYYICYHITSTGKYPFVQIMLQLKEDFVLPSITIDIDSQDVNASILKKIKDDFKNMRCEMDDCIYRGMFSDLNNKTNNSKVYALIDVSSVDISCLKLSKTSSIWFALPTEIINIGSICDISINEDVKRFFTYVMPELGVVYKTDKFKEPYLLPDVVYTSSSLKQAEFQTLFGPSKDYDNEWYHFYGSFFDLSNEVKEAINRYALFIENPIIFNSKFELEEKEKDKDKTWDQFNCIIIQNIGILVNEYEQFIPLSFHTLDTVSTNIKAKIK